MEMGRREMKWRRQRAGGTAGPGEWHVLAGSCRCLLAGEQQAGGQMSTRKTQGKGYCKQEPGETGKVCQARHRQGSTGDRELFHYVSPYFLHSRLFRKS